MINSINSSSDANSILTQYNTMKNQTKSLDATTKSDDVYVDEEVETTEDAINSILEDEESSSSNPYNLSFSQRNSIQQQMQMESMITQFNTSNKSDSSSSNASTMYSILQGQQAYSQIGVINSNVSATTSDKNSYISDKINATDETDTTNSTDETNETDTTIDNSQNVKHIDIHL